MEVERVPKRCRCEGLVNIIDIQRGGGHREASAGYELRRTTRDGVMIKLSVAAGAE